MSAILQTYNFPRLGQPEQSWEHSLRALMQLTYPGPGIYQGLTLTTPAGSDNLCGLTPGYAIAGDSVVGPIGVNTMPPLPRNVNLKDLYYSIPRGYLFYEDTTKPATTPQAQDIVIAKVSSSDEAAPKLKSTAQVRALGNGRYILQGLLYLGKMAAGSVKLIDFAKPAGVRFFRAEYAMLNIITAAATVTATDDVLALEYETNTITKAALVSMNNATLGGAAGGKALATTSPISNLADTRFSLFHNLTDTNTSIASGVIEYAVGLQCF